MKTSAVLHSQLMSSIHRILGGRRWTKWALPLQLQHLEGLGNIAETHSNGMLHYRARRRLRRDRGTRHCSSVDFDDFHANE
jgi:hypothetical protein